MKGNRKDGWCLGEFVVSFFVGPYKNFTSDYLTERSVSMWNFVFLPRFYLEGERLRGKGFVIFQVGPRINPVYLPIPELRDV